VNGLGYSAIEFTSTHPRYEISGVPAFFQHSCWLECGKGSISSAKVGQASVRHEKWAYTPVIVEVYKSETQEVLHRFLGHRLKFPACIAALDAALAGLIPKLKPEQPPELRTIMLANNERVMKEMHKRERQRKANADAYANTKKHIK
jgi:hypothetical protein